MTVADKLVYLSDTKNILADAINSYTQVITPDTPFREYAQWIDNIVFSAEGGIPSLFDGEAGFAWSGLPYYQDPAGTTVASWGDPVGLISDDSGNGADFTQPTVTARPTLRNDPPRLEFDLVDDLLQTTLPAITNGTLVLAGANGVWIDDDFNHMGGAFTVGPTTYTGGPDGILPIVGDLIVGGSFAIDRQLTAQERVRVISKLKSMGAPGVFELGPELVVNGAFDTDISGWVNATPDRGNLSWQAGRLRLDQGGISNAPPVAYSPITLDSEGAQYIISCDRWGQPPFPPEIRVGSTVTSGEYFPFIDSYYAPQFSRVFTPASASSYVQLRPGTTLSVSAGDYVEYDNISVRKLELVP